MSDKAIEFWKRVDKELYDYKILYTMLCEETGINYGTLTMQRNRQIFPKVEQVSAIAEVLNCSIDYLVNGEDVVLSPPRIQRITEKLQTSDETTLQLVERVLQIEAPVSMEKRGLNIG